MGEMTKETKLLNHDQLNFVFIFEKKKKEVPSLWHSTLRGCKMACSAEWPSHFHPQAPGPGSGADRCDQSLGRPVRGVVP